MYKLQDSILILSIKNAAFREAYLKDISFFAAAPRHFLRSSLRTPYGRKRTGVLHGVYFVKGKALQIIKINKVKIFQYILK